MSLLVTGHKGFIGTHLTKELDKRKIKWAGYDLQDGNDTRDKQNLDEFFEKNQITEVIHLAALAGVRRSKKYPQEYISTNILGTQNIVDLCQDYKVNKIIFYSSSSVYGNVNKLPVIEKQEKNPISLYGVTKLAGEHIIKSSTRPSVIIRPFTVYGEDGRKDEVVYKWIEQIKNGLPISIYAEKTGPSTYEPKSCRGYVYVKDLVKTTADLIQRGWDWQHEDFNVGGSEVIYLQDILNEFQSFYKDLKKKIIPRKKEDVKNQYANTNKARTMLGFNPKPNFIKNLKRILRKYGSK